MYDTESVYMFYMHTNWALPTIWAGARAQYKIVATITVVTKSHSLESKSIFGRHAKWAKYQEKCVSSHFYKLICLLAVGKKFNIVMSFFGWCKLHRSFFCRQSFSGPFTHFYAYLVCTCHSCQLQLMNEIIFVSNNRRYEFCLSYRMPCSFNLANFIAYVHTTFTKATIKLAPKENKLRILWIAQAK